jgi:hypothetical protein
VLALTFFWVFDEDDEVDKCVILRLWTYLLDEKKNKTEQNTRRMVCVSMTTVITCQMTNTKV